MRRKFWIQVWIYSRYFMRVLWDNPTVLVYTVGLPVGLLLLNSHALLFKALTTEQYINSVLPYVAWMIFSNTLVCVTDVALLREQGYLKQYAALVVTPAVFIVSEALLNLAVLGVMVGLVGLASVWLFQLSFTVIWQLLGTLIIVYLPMVAACLPLLSWQMRAKTVNAVMNVWLLAVMLIPTFMSHVMTISINNWGMNLVSPAWLVGNTYATLTNGHWATFGLTYAMVVIIWVAVAGVSYRRLKLLPTEGL